MSITIIVDQMPPKLHIKESMDKVSVHCLFNRYKSINVNQTYKDSIKRSLIKTRYKFINLNTESIVTVCV